MTRSSICVAVLCGVLASGCSLFSTKADVSSDTSWSGSFNGTTVQGTGSRSVDLGGGSGAKCAVVQKQTTQGYLTVSISGGGESKTTYADYGVVSVCSTSTP